MPRKHRPPRPRDPKACRACAYAKVRCESTAQDGSACKRCLRLKKDCTMQLPGVHKGVGPRPDITRLEKKINDMAAAVTASPRPLLSASADGPGGGATCITRQSIFADISNEEAQRMLHRFQTEMASYFPFVAVPPDTTASELRQSRPFVFCAVAMVSCRDNTERQLGMARSIREYAGSAIVAWGEKGLDLLQGLLVCLGWYHFQLELGSQIRSILHLSLAMLSDLGLNCRPSSVKRILPLESFPADYERQIIHRTLDERRAYLGCFYISAMVSICHGAIDPIRYTDYTEECCHAIAQAAEHPNDLYLVHLVRLHRLSDSIGRIHCSQIDPPGIPSAPIPEAIKAVETELRHFKPRPSNTLHDSILLLQYHDLEISLYDVALEDDFLTNVASTSKRASIIFSCLAATRTFFDAFSSIPPQQYPSLPYPVYAAYSHALGTLSRLLLFTGKGWDLEHTRSIVDIHATIDTLITGMEKGVMAQHDGQPEYHFSEALAKMTPRLRAFGEYHKIKCSALQTNSSEQSLDKDPATASEDAIQDIMFPLPHGLSWRILRPP